MRLRPFIKLGFPVWARVPGTPFTLPGPMNIEERLPGMNEWAPRSMIERVSRQLNQNEDLEDIAQRESLMGKGTIGRWGLAGTVGGGLLGRLVGGEQGIAPMKELLSQGINRGTLRGLLHTSPWMKYAPLAGLGTGLGIGYMKWREGQQGRAQQAREVSKGLLAEKLLQRNALREAFKSDLPYSASILRGIPVSSASSSVPHVVSSGGGIA